MRAQAVASGANASSVLVLQPLGPTSAALPANEAVQQYAFAQRASAGELLGCFKARMGRGCWRFVI